MAAIWVLLLCIYPTNSRSVYGEAASVHQTKCISISDRVFSSILEYRVAIVHVQAIAFSYPHTRWALCLVRERVSDRERNGNRGDLIIQDQFKCSTSQRMCQMDDKQYMNNSD